MSYGMEEWGSERLFTDSSCFSLCSCLHGNMGMEDAAAAGAAFLGAPACNKSVITAAAMILSCHRKMLSVL